MFYGEYHYDKGKPKYEVSSMIDRLIRSKD